jgi:hypothetical protein
MESEKQITLSPAVVTEPARRHTRAQMALAFGVAAVSDVIMIWTEFVPPIQWAIDGATALALYLILGRRKALLAGLIIEAIPGMGVFPAWVLVVLSIILYDGIRKPQRIQ